MERNYIAFISYRHMPLDIAVAKKLHSLIEQYGIPKDLRRDSGRKLGIVFRDQEELAASSDLSRDIREALDHSKYLIVVCSRDTPASPWVTREITCFLQEHPRENVLTVLISGEPAEAFPQILTASVDGAQNIEPLAVDIRASSVSRTLSRLKKESLRLFAAMLGCPYDALALRDQKRQFRKVGIAAGTAVVVAAGFISLLWLKNGQIEKRNQELAAQKAELQYSQSQLLTEDAEEALEAGNYRDAIEKAVNALPKEGETDRPFYAPAERVLLRALNIFDTSDDYGVLRKIELTQMTSVEDFCIQQSGDQAVTIDAYGTVHCFSIENGQILWSARVQGDENSFFSGEEHLFLSGDQERVICYYKNKLTCCEIVTGKTLWTRSICDSAENYYFYNEKQDVFLYAALIPSDDYTVESVELTVLSGMTGDIIQSIPFAVKQFDVPLSFVPSHEKALPKGGIFSEDGTLFVGVFVEDKTTWESCVMNCFVVNLADGTGEIFYRQEIESSYLDFAVTGMKFQDQCQSLVVAIQGVKNTVAATVYKIDLPSGDILWQTAMPDELEDPFTFGVVDSFMAFQEEYAIIARYKGIYCLDLSTGELWDSARLPYEINALKEIDSHTFEFILTDGTCGVGWRSVNGIMLSTDSFCNVSVSLGEHSRAKIYGGGIVQYYKNGSRIEISVSNSLCDGCVAVIPYEENFKVIISQPRDISQYIERTEIPISLECSSAGRRSSVMWDEHVLILGPYSKRAKGPTQAFDYYIVLDTQTHEIIQTIPIDDLSYGDRVHILPDLQGYINCKADGRVSLKKGGIVSQIASEERYFFTSDICNSVYLDGSGDVLTAKYCPNTLILWRNGMEEARVALPQKLIDDEECMPEPSRNLVLGTNGYILLSQADWDEETSLSNMSIYDYYNGNWIDVEGNTGVPNWNAITISDTKPYWAMVGNDDTAYIYQILTGEEVSAIPLSFPCNAVQSLTFLLDNTCLMIQTTDGQLLIYEINTGSILFQGQLYGDILAAYTDDENQWLYVSCEGNSSAFDSLCVDLQSWTKLADLNMVYYDTTKRELYRSSSYDPIVISRIPTTAELVQLGQQIVDQPS